MRSIVLTTIYQDVSDEDIKQYCRRLNSNPLLLEQSIGEKLQKTGKARFETPPAVGQKNAVTEYEIIES